MLDLLTFWMIMFSWMTTYGPNWRVMMTLLQTESVNCLNQPGPRISNVQLLSPFQIGPSKNGEISNRKILLLEV